MRDATAGNGPSPRSRDRRATRPRTPHIATAAVATLLWPLVLTPAALAADHSPRPDELPEVYNWETLEVLGVNREPAHATLMPHASREAALAADPSGSPWRLSLNGTWKFHWVRAPADRPLNFFEEGYDVRGWDDIEVPSPVGPL